jgi:hypothetical protein
MPRFKATDEQILQMAEKAFNSSTPIGLGILKFNPHTDKLPGNPMNYLRSYNDGRSAYIHLDYVEGRMVKFAARKEGDVWDMHEPRWDYQSWVGTYPTARDLIESVGAEVLEGGDGEE